MKIVVLLKTLGGCEYVRTVLPFLALRELGHDVIFADRALTPAARQSVIDQGIEPLPVGTCFTYNAEKTEAYAHEPDVLVLQRPTDPAYLEIVDALHERGRTVIVELDDNFREMGAVNPNFKDHGPGTYARHVMDEYVRRADVLLVSTEHLGYSYAELRDGPIVVAENTVCDRQFERLGRVDEMLLRPMNGAQKRPERLAIGWAGSATHDADLRMVRAPLCAILAQHPKTQLIFVGADMRQMFTSPQFYLPDEVLKTAAGPVLKRHRNRVEFGGAVYPNAERGFHQADLTNDEVAPVVYFDLIDACGLDIAIAPIEDTPFNRSKSWIKALEYAMLGIPLIASNVGPYAHLAKRAELAGYDEIMLLADTVEDWERCLRLLVVSPETRSRLARAARRYIAEHHLTSQNVDKWEHALQQLPNYVRPFQAMEAVA